MEFYTACALLVVLPLSEALKSALLALLLILVLWRLGAARNFFSRRPDIVEWVLIGLLGASMLSTLLNLPYNGPFKGVLDSFRYIALFWVFYRRPWSLQQLKTLAFCILAGVLLADLLSLYELYSGKINALELHSVGVVTHSSLYQGMAGVLAAGFLIAALQQGKAAWRELLFWSVLLFLLTLFLFMMGSRGGILAYGLTLVGALLLLKQRLALLFTLIAVGCSVLLAGLMAHNANQTYMQEKLRQLTLEGQLPEADQIRLSNWRVAIKQITQGDALIVGLGPRNFSAIQVERFDFDPPLPAGVTFQNHAHNLFLTKAVEEGLLGLSVFVLFLSLAAHRLYREFRLGKADWLWVGGLGALMIPVLGGQFNTPFYQEQAMLAMSLMALFMGRARHARASAAR
jgi:O-antigen ligase